MELFDLSADVAEARDLAAADPRRAAAMRARLRQWRQSIGAQENTPNPGLEAERYNRIYADVDSSRFDPLAADDEAWKAVAVWRQRVVGAPDFSALTFAVNGSKFLIGDFINAVVSFLLIAGAIYFFVVTPMNAITARIRRGDTPADPTTKTCPECLSEIPAAVGAPLGK